MLGPLSRYAPPPGTQLLLALLCGLTLATAWATSALTVLTLLPGAPEAFHPIALVTNGLVAAPVGPGGFILLIALIGFFNQQAVIYWWRRAPQQVLAWTLGPLVALFVLDHFVLRGYAFGLAADAVLLGWTGTAVERIWGRRRLLWFVAVASVVVNTVAALLMWQAPGTLAALAGPGGAAPIGAGPVSYGLLTVWCLAQGDRVLAIINAPARKLIVALALLKGLDLIFVGVATGLCGLAGIGTALLLVSGRWDPRRWRKPKPRPRPRLVRDDEDRDYHRGRVGASGNFVQKITRMVPSLARRVLRSCMARPEGKTMRRGMIFAIISALCGAPSLAMAAPAPVSDAPALAADPAAPPASATAAYQAGVTHFEGRRFGQALAAFERALRIAPASAVLVFNLARTFEELRAVDPAIEHYQRYLRMRPEADDREAVLAAIARLRGAAQGTAANAAGTITVTSTPDGAEVFLDGRAEGRTPATLITTAGVHYVTVSMDGFSRASQEVTVVDGETTRHTATLVPTTQAVGRGEDDLAGWMLVGFGSTLLIGGGVFGALALDQDGRLDAIEAGDRPATRAEFNDAQETGRLYAYLADGLLIGGLAAAITGGIVLLTDEAPRTARDTSAMAWNF